MGKKVAENKLIFFGCAMQGAPSNYTDFYAPGRVVH